jgi:hypothetical protein
MIRNSILFFAGLWLVAACTSTPAKSGDARLSIEQRYNNRIGSATKEDFVQDFGAPNWCRGQSTGGETCRFYKKTGVVWTGSETDRQHHDTYDEVVADFDSNGILKNFKAAAQR